MNEDWKPDALFLGGAAVAFGVFLTTLTLDRSQTHVAVASAALALALPVSTASYVFFIFRHFVDSRALRNGLLIASIVCFMVGFFASLTAVGELFAYLSPSSQATYNVVLRFVNYALGLVVAAELFVKARKRLFARPKT